MDRQQVDEPRLFSSDGQERRAWLEGQAGQFENALKYYLGPQGYQAVENAVRLFNVLSPGADVQEASEAAGRMLEADGIVETAAEGAAMAGALAAIMMPGGAASLRQGIDDVAADLARAYDPNVVNVFTAYHGSPHDFDKFRMDRIGTGEGSQAYGHGLYFAESENVARGYRDELMPAPPANDVVGQAYAFVQDMGGNRKLAAETLRRTIDRNDPRYEFSQAMANAIETGEIDNYIAPGRLYEVSIDADPDAFLDWDAPLSEQTEAVQNLAALQGINAPEVKWQWNGYTGSYSRPNVSGTGSLHLGRVTNLGPNQYEAKIGRQGVGVFRNLEDAKSALDQALMERGQLPEQTLNYRGRDLYEHLAGGVDNMVREAPNREDATSVMRDAGIPGIRYYDALSRGQGRGTRNYVVFDEDIINIVRKYGIAAAAPMLGMTAAELQQRLQGMEQPEG